MRVHWLQHAEFEDTGCIAPWLLARGHLVTETRLQRGETLPDCSRFDALVVMGGPMNIYEDELHPWLRQEKKLIREAIDAGRRVLGICLGAQLVADVLGGKVTRNAETEIGWFPLTLTEPGRAHALLAGLLATFTGFHWHGDTYALPAGATCLATSEACGEQAFAWDSGRVLGLQFHLEVTRDDLQRWFESETPTPSKYVQSAETILADGPAFDSNNRWMTEILERFFA